MREQTRKKIMDAFWELFRKRDVAHITVGDIVEKAGYSRMTFYSYFTDVYDLLDQFEDELIENLEQNVSPHIQLSKREDEQELAAISEEFDLESTEKLIVLFGEHGDPNFPPKIKAALKEHLPDVTGLPQEEEYTDYMTAFVLYARWGILDQWHRTGEHQTREEMLKITYQLIFNGINGFAKMFSQDNEQAESN